MTATVTVALVQLAATGDVLAKTAVATRDAARRGANIVCLQELFATPYFAREERADLLALAEPDDGPTATFLSSLAKDNGVAVIGGSFYELGQDGNRYNTCLGFDASGTSVFKYRKVHVPHDPNYWERYYFRGGDLGYVDAVVHGTRVAPLICYDQWFPEPARVLALRGVKVLFYPTAIGWFEAMREHEPFSAARWEDAMRAHASMNGIYVVAVNRVGTEGYLDFWGGSFVADPFGQVISRASATNEETLVAELDLDAVERSQDGWMFLHHRRPDTYGDLVKQP